jgi:hypothetical protein
MPVRSGVSETRSGAARLCRRASVPSQYRRASVPSQYRRASVPAASDSPPASTRFTMHNAALRCLETS